MMKESVNLTNYIYVKSHCAPELHFQHDVKIDPEVTQTLLDFLAHCIDLKKGPIMVEQLFQIVCCNLPEEIWSNLFNTPTHLLSFLRLFSDSFHIQSNLVTLLQQPKIDQNKLIKNEPPNPPIRCETPIKKEEINESQNVIEPMQVQETVEKCVVNNSPQQLSPKSISDRLKQPKLQTKLMLETKTKSPEPPPNLFKASNQQFRLQQ